jgi:hypothetical protein
MQFQNRNVNSTLQEGNFYLMGASHQWQRLKICPVPNAILPEKP